MDEYAPCPQCEHKNLPDNRFCGRCGVSLTSSKQLVPRRVDHSPVAKVQALPAKLGPTGKALAMSLATLAAEASLLWLRRRVERTGHRPPLLPDAQESKPASSAYFVSQSLEEVSVWLQGGDYHSHLFARRVSRSVERSFPGVRR